MAWALLLNRLYQEIAIASRKNAAADQSGSAAAQMGGVANSLGGAEAEARLAAWYDEFWASETKGLELVGRATSFFTFVIFRIRVMSKARDATGSTDVSAIKRQYDRLLDQVADQLVVDFIRDVDEGLKIWQELLDRHWHYVTTRNRLAQFRQSLEKRLLEAYFARATARLTRQRQSLSISEFRLRRHVDLVRNIILDHRQEYRSAVLAGINAWSIPLVPPDHWGTVLSGGGGFAGGVGSFLTALPSVGPGAAAITAIGLTPAGVIGAGIVLIVAGTTLSVLSAWETMKKEEEQHRQKVLERILKGITRSGVGQEAELVEDKQDLLALAFAVEAIGQGMNFETVSTETLRDHIWRSLFGNFPEDFNQGVQRTVQQLEADFNKKLNPAA